MPDTIDFEPVDTITRQVTGSKRWRLARNRHAPHPTVSYATLDAQLMPELRLYTHDRSFPTCSSRPALPLTACLCHGAPSSVVARSLTPLSSWTCGAWTASHCPWPSTAAATFPSSWLRRQSAGLQVPSRGRAPSTACCWIMPATAGVSRRGLRSGRGGASRRKRDALQCGTVPPGAQRVAVFSWCRFRCRHSHSPTGTMTRRCQPQGRAAEQVDTYGDDEHAVITAPPVVPIATPPGAQKAAEAPA